MMRLRRLIVLGSIAVVAATGAFLGAGALAQSGSSGPPTDYGLGPTDISHFSCYIAANTGSSSLPAQPFKVPPVVDLQNQFNPQGFFTAVRGLVWHCNPTQKTVGGVVTPITDPNAHLACFVLPASTANTPASVLQNPYTVAITNQFGTGTLTTGPPRLLCLPSWKNLTTATALTQPPGLDHYACYQVTNNANMPRPPSSISLQDQFNNQQSPPTQTTVVLGAPNLLCLPTLKTTVAAVGPTPSQLFHPDAHLVCYPVVRLANQASPAGGFVTDENQFGIGTVKIGALHELCVPSTKMISRPSNTLVITKVATDQASGVNIPLSGATFTATPSVASNPSGSCTTDATGTCTITGLATDTYTITETSAPSGYSGGPPQTATFTSSPESISLTFNDTPATQGTNTLDITKETNPNSLGGPTPLAGATFTAVGSLATSPTGTCTTDSTGTCSITGLATDTYTVTETTPPSGYSAAPPQSVTFTTSPQTISLTFTDSPTPPGPANTLNLKKVGPSRSGAVVALAGATFTAEPSVPTNPGGACTTNASGTCSITGLAIDTYTVTETTPPSGYSAGASQTVTFTMAPQTLSLKFNDTLVAGTPAG